MSTNEILVNGYKQGVRPLAILLAVEVLRILGSDPAVLLDGIPVDYLSEARKEM